MHSGVEDKVIMVLGGAGGIGSACARLLASQGALLALADIDTQGLSTVVEDIAGAGGAVRGHHVDVTMRDQPARAVDDIVAEHGRLDVVINAAGIMYIRPVLEANTAEWDHTVDLNIKGTLWGVAAALPVFQRQGAGHFVTLGSVHGQKVLHGGTVHSAAKSAVHAFAEGLRTELASTAIRVTNIVPGAVNTGIHKITTGAVTAQITQLYEAAIPPQAVANAVAFAVGQPEDVAINEIVIRPTSQEF